MIRSGPKGSLRRWEASFREATSGSSGKVKWFVLPILFAAIFFTALWFLQPWAFARILPYLPLEEKSIAFYRDFFQLALSEVIWLSGFLLLAFFLGAYIPLNRLKDVEYRLLKKFRTYTCAIIGLSFGAALMVAYYSLEQFPNSSDEYVYLYQAQTLSKGKLWEQAHALPDFFYFNHIARKDGVSVGRFPPGWPAILSVSFFLGIPPFLVNPVLGLLSLIVFCNLAVKLYGQRVALWALPALALTSFYIFNSASFFSHSSCLLGTLLFVLGIYLYVEKQKPAYLLLAGFALGIMMTIRYYTALIVFLPFFFFLLHQYRLKAIGIFFWIGIGSLPWMIAGFWYNYSITGNPLMPVTRWAFEDESLGFVKGHTLLKGLEHIIRWMLMFLYWCSPALLILYFVILWNKLKHPVERWMNPEDYIFILLLIGYFFYYEIGGNQYGPRFFFEALPFVILLVVRKIIHDSNKWMLALFFAGMIYGVVRLPFIAFREHRVVEERNDVYHQVKTGGITNAVIFISTHTGVIRPMTAGDLTRNDVSFTNDVLYALDLKEKNEILMRYYPDRTFYRYVKDKEEVEGRLVRVK